MLVSDIISRVRSLAGDFTALQFTDTQIIEWINDGIGEVVIDNRLCQKTASQNTVVNQAAYTLPPDIFKLYSVLVNGNKIKVYTLEEWEKYSAETNASSDKGQPFQCYVWAGSLTLYPIPDTVYPLQINYIYNPAPLTTDTQTPDIPSVYHTRLVTFCLAKVAFQDDDINKYNELMQNFRDGVLDLKGDHDSEEDLYAFMSVSPRDTGTWYMGEAYYG